MTDITNTQAGVQADYAGDLFGDIAESPAASDDPFADWLTPAEPAAPFASSVKLSSLRFSMTKASSMKTGDGGWKERASPDWATLVKMASTGKIGAKDGPCYVPGLLDGEQRLKEKVLSISFMVLDVDCGHTREEVESGLKRLGVAFAAHTTYSHTAATTDISVEKLDAWKRQNPGGTPIDYLREKKHYLPRVLENATKWQVSKDKTNYRMHHNPCDKWRILLPLDRPFVIADFPTRYAAEHAWESIRDIVAAEIGVKDDRSCNDLSRLFYPPRRPKDRPFDALHGGTAPLSLDALLAGVAPMDTSRAGAVAPAERVVVVADTGKPFDLGAWETAGYGRRLMLRTLIEARLPHLIDSTRSEVRDGKLHVECPFNEEHTVAGPDGGTFVSDADGGHRFAFHCIHNACNERTSLDHLARWVADGVLTPADLYDERFLVPLFEGVDWPEMDRMEADKAETEAVRKLGAEDLIPMAESLDATTTTRFVDKLLKRAAAIDLPLIESDLLLKAINKATKQKMPMASLRDTLKKARKAKASAEAERRRLDGQKDTPAWVKDMNERHCVVNNGGKVSVFQREYDPTLDRWFYCQSAFTDIANLYCNTLVTVGSDDDGNPVTAPLGKAWLNHSGRRTYLGGSHFMPEGGEPDNVLNLWSGWGVDPAPGDWSLFRQMMLTDLCGGDEGLFAYLLGWMATAVQHPARPGEVAVVLQGARGAGKGTFAREFGRLFGAHFLHLRRAEQITGRFSSHLRDACVVFADEAFFAGDKAHANALKAIITEETLYTEAKFENGASTRNVVHLIMASNEDWVVDAGMDERRFFILKIRGVHANDSEYFGRIQDQMRNGGSAALLHDLLHYDLTGFDVRRAPKTEGLKEQKRRSLDVVGRWWLDRLHRGDIPAGWLVDLAGDDWLEASVEVWRDTMFDDFRRETDRAVYRGRELSIPAFGLALRKYVTLGGDDKQKRREGKAKRVWELPALPEARAQFERAVGGSFDWDA